MQKLPLGVGVVVFGIVVLYLAMTGKLDRFAKAWADLTGKTTDATASNTAFSLPTLPQLPTLPPIASTSQSTFPGIPA